MITLKHGDILHCRSNGVLGRIIRKITSSDFNHSATVIKIDGEIFVSGSQSNGTNLKTFENWMHKYNYEFVVSRYKHTTQNWGKNYRKRALSVVGVTGYDYASLILWQPIFMLTKKWKGRKAEKAAKRMYCSEYVAFCHNIPNWFEMNPGMLYDFCLKSKHFDTIIH